jgi:hypothetical protein
MLLKIWHRSSKRNSRKNVKRSKPKIPKSNPLNSKLTAKMQNLKSSRTKTCLWSTNLERSQTTSPSTGTPALSKISKLLDTICLKLTTSLKDSRPKELRLSQR